MTKKIYFICDNASYYTERSLNFPYIFALIVEARGDFLWEI